MILNCSYDHSCSFIGILDIPKNCKKMHPMQLQLQFQYNYNELKKVLCCDHSHGLDCNAKQKIKEKLNGVFEIHWVQEENPKCFFSL